MFCQGPYALCKYALPAVRGLSSLIASLVSGGSDDHPYIFK